MIEALGYARGPDGIFVDRAGQKLQEEIRTTAGDDLKSKVMLTLSDDWKNLGVDAPTVTIPRQLTVRVADKDDGASCRQNSV